MGEGRLAQARKSRWLCYNGRSGRAAVAGYVRHAEPISAFVVRFEKSSWKQGFFCVLLPGDELPC